MELQITSKTAHLCSGIAQREREREREREIQREKDRKNTMATAKVTVNCKAHPLFRLQK